MQGGSGQLAAISRKGKAMKYKIILSAALLALGLASSVSANSIKHVFVVDELTLEVEMAAEYYVQKHGVGALSDVAKLHFVTTQKVLQPKLGI